MKKVEEKEAFEAYAESHSVDIKPYHDDNVIFRRTLWMNYCKDTHKTCSSPRCPLRSHSLVCIEKHLFIVGIRPILNKELKLIFRSDCSDRTYVYS